MRSSIAAAIVVVVSGLAPAPTSAHPLAPALLDLVERPGGLVRVTWQTSRLQARGAHVVPVLPPACTPRTAARRAVRGAAVRTRWIADCGAAGLVGRALAVHGLEGAGHEALVRVAFADGRVVHRLLGANDARWTIPARPGAGALLRGYARLGVAHILGGLDHLLFVLGLVLLGRTLRRVAATVTAFTVGHSATLSLAATGGVAVPAAPVELLIAASVWWLALEVAHAPAGRGPVARRPWVAAGGFGLLHGLGFAAALREAGLPASDVPLALVGFNVGVELGQLAFVVLALALLAVPARLAGRLADRVPSWTHGLPATAMGALATYWCLDRLAGMVR